MMECLSFQSVVGDACWVLMASNSFADTPQDGRKENKRIKKGTSYNKQKGVAKGNKGRNRLVARWALCTVNKGFGMHVPP
jgi:hypothetical protein